MALSEQCAPEAREVIIYKRPVKGIHLTHYTNGAPDYNPKFWNANKDRFSCYAYAMRLMGNGWCVPGQLLNSLSGVWETKKLQSEEELYDGLIFDGHKRILESEISPEKHILVVVYNVASSKSEFNYHVASIDSDGLLSDKEGHHLVKKLEDLDLTSEEYPESLGCFEFSKSGVPFFPK